MRALLSQPVALALHIECGGMMEQVVENRGGEDLIARRELALSRRSSSPVRTRMRSVVGPGVFNPGYPVSGLHRWVATMLMPPWTVVRTVYPKRSRRYG